MVLTQLDKQPENLCTSSNYLACLLKTTRINHIADMIHGSYRWFTITTLVLGCMVVDHKSLASMLLHINFYIHVHTL